MSDPISSHRSVRRHLTVACLALLGAALAASGVRAQLGGDRDPKARFELVADRTAYGGGDELRLAALVTVEPTWHVQAHQPSLEYLIPTELELELPDGWPAPKLSYPEPTLWQSSFETEPLLVYEETFPIFAELVLPEDLTAGEVTVEARLRYQACDDRICLPPTEARAAVRLALGATGTPTRPELFAGAEAASGAASAHSERGLLFMLALAALGGLVLNAMPCVLPVLSLKVFSLVKAAGAGRREVVLGALATGGGIVLSFWALATAAVAVRAAGSLVGWGIQFQNPGFVAFLTLVVVLFALNLWGLFEIPLPAGLARLAEGRPKQGVAGHLWWGIFATLMATPCSAPFLGTAVGFALSQKSTTIFAIFTAVGLGMAAPYLVLAIVPQAASALPKPGAWMETLRGLMGFLLAGTAVWLLYVLSAQIDPVRLAVVEIGLLALGLCAWLLRHAGRPAARVAAAVGLLLVAAATLGLAATAPPRSAPEVAGASGRIPWQPWDRTQAEALARAGRLVFVDVTADWCATCKFNERLVLETDAIASLFREHEVVAMKADWTSRDDEITTFLAEHGRYGIPFYVLYRPGADAHVFSELLTRTAVTGAIESAAVAVAHKP
jgi:suppressor for copper-sensitivity B